MNFLKFLYNNVSNEIKGFSGDTWLIFLLIILCDLKGSLQSKYPPSLQIVLFCSDTGFNYDSSQTQWTQRLLAAKPPSEATD